MNRAYIHIGLEKTGTTSLQAFLKANEGELRKAGFSYLGDDTKLYFDRGAHFPIAACLHDSRPDFVSPGKYRPRSQVLGELRRDVEACPYDIIISCEHFSSRLHSARLHSKEPLEAIKESFPGRDLKIVFYLRRQDELALSAYSTAVLCGRRIPPSVEEVINPKVRYFDFLGKCELWASVFGSKNILIKEFDRKTLAGGDIRLDFLRLLGIDSKGFVLGDDKNVSLDATQLEVLRLVNRYLCSFGETGKGTYEFSQQVRGTLAQYLPKGQSLNSLFSAADRRAILSNFRDRNERLADTFLGTEFLRRWNSLPLAKEPENSGITVTADMLIPIIATLGRQLVEARQQNEGVLGTSNVTSRLNALETQHEELRQQFIRAREDFRQQLASLRKVDDRGAVEASQKSMSFPKRIMAAMNRASRVGK